MRITLVLNGHDTVSETFQRSLARVLAGAGHQVTVHALRGGSAAGNSRSDRGGEARIGSDRTGVRRSVALPPVQARSLPRILVRVLGGRDVAMVTAVRRSYARYGATRRAVRAALYAGPIMATRPEVVHLGQSGLGVALADVLALLGDARVVVSCRGTDELVRPVLDSQRAGDLGTLLRSVDVIHVVADAVGEAVLGLGAPADRIRVIRPAVDLVRWIPGDRTPDHSGLAIVAVARLEAAKGLDDLIAAVASVRSAGVDARLRIVGDGPHRDALRLRIARSGLDDAVVLVGSLELEAVRRELVAADVFASASLSEGISNGVLEAMATGRAVVSTKVGGMAEVITDGVDGWLVPPGRPDRLSAALAHAARAPAERRAVAAAGRRRVEEAFDLGRQRTELLALYDEFRRPRTANPSP